MLGFQKSKRKKEIELEREIPQAKNPSGLSDRGALSQERLRKRPVRRGGIGAEFSGF